MLVGVDYYPEHWDEARWPLDADLMREAGIKIARLAEFAWCKMEPREGRFDFAWLERVSAILHDRGIKVVLCTPTAAPPAWLHEHYPDIYPADARRYRLGFGTRYQRCLNNPTMRRYSRLITEAMAAHFAANPAVIGWQTDNELIANICYCDVCAAGFRDWLRERYGTLDALNATWGTIFWSQEYSGWSQIPLPWEARLGRMHNPSLLLDYQRFASESAVSFQREQIEIIRSLAPGHFVTHNLMGLHDSQDYYRLAEDLDFISWDNYPSTPWTKPEQAALAHDVMRGIKQRGFWVMEEQSGIVGWDRMSRRPKAGEVRAWAWQAVAHGAETVVFFRWRSCLYGTEQNCHGILNHDGQPRRRYREVARFGREMEKFSAALDGSVVRTPLAILNSYDQNWALQIQPQADGLGWWEQTGRFHDALTRLGHQVDVVPITVDLKQYRVVVLPSWFLLTAADADKLAEFVRGGGILIVNPRTGVKDACNTCHPSPLPSLLGEVLGLEVDDYDPLGKAENRVRMMDGGEYAVSAWADAVLAKGAEPLAVYTQSEFAGEPAVTRNRYGGGTAYYLGTCGEPAFYDAFFRIALAETELQGLAGLPEGVEAGWRVKESESYLFLINLTDAEKLVPVPEGLDTLLGEKPDRTAVRLPGHEVGIYRRRSSI